MTSTGPVTLSTLRHRVKQWLSNDTSVALWAKDPAVVWTEKTASAVAFLVGLMKGWHISIVGLGYTVHLLDSKNGLRTFLLTAIFFIDTLPSNYKPHMNIIYNGGANVLYCWSSALSGKSEAVDVDLER
jgi:hypothetical protein